MQGVLLPGAMAGFVLGVAFIVLHTAGDALSYGTQEILGIAAIVVAICAAQVFVVSRQPATIAKEFLPRYFAAVLSAVAAAVVYGITTWLHFTVIDTNYLSRFYAQYLERVRAKATTPEESEQLIVAAERMKDFVMDPLSQAMVQFGTVLMLGLLTGVIVTALMKPKTRA